MCRQQNVSLAGGFSFGCIWKRGGDLCERGGDLGAQGDDMRHRGDDCWRASGWLLAVANKQAVGQKPDVYLESAPPLFYR